MSMPNQPIECCEKCWDLSLTEDSRTCFIRDCPCHQPIEEKWKGSWRWRSDRMGLDKDQHDEILDFIENLLEQEKNIMAGAIEMSKQGWIDEGRIEEKKRMSEEVEKRKMDGYCKYENCSHDECGTIRWFNKGLNISLSIINK